MKKIFTLLVSSLFSISLFAFDGSHLSIYKVNNTMKLKIEVDGQKVMMTGNSITLTNLPEGNHNLRIYRETGKDDLMNSYGRAYEIIYATSVYLGKAYQVDITINGSGRVIVDAYRTDDGDDCYDGTNGGYGHKESDEMTNGAGWITGNSNVMSVGEFSQLKEQISKEWFESNKLTSVKTIIDKYNLTTWQVADLMFLFSFESNKLDIAKYAYCSTVDKQNYFKLNDALTYSSSKDELARFIRESH